MISVLHYYYKSYLQAYVQLFMNLKFNNFKFC
jgi:hypothetical protein